MLHNVSSRQSRPTLASYWFVSGRYFIFNGCFQRVLLLKMTFDDEAETKTRAKRGKKKELRETAAIGLHAVIWRRLNAIISIRTAFKRACKYSVNKELANMCISLCVILFHPTSSLNKSCTGFWTQMQYLCIVGKYHTGDPGSEGAPSPRVCVCSLQSGKRESVGSVCIPLMNGGMNLPLFHITCHDWKREKAGNSKRRRKVQIQLQVL